MRMCMGGMTEGSRAYSPLGSYRREFMTVVGRICGPLNELWELSESISGFVARSMDSEREGGVILN